MRTAVVVALTAMTLALAATSGANATPLPSRANTLPAIVPNAGAANPTAKLHLAHHARYHYCTWSRDYWGRPYYHCWWDKRLRRRGWY